MADLKVEIDQIVNNITIDEENVVVELGTSGPQGARGTGILNGTSAPNNNIGIIGDFFLNTTNMNLYGPKTESGWGSPVDLSWKSGTWLCSYTRSCFCNLEHNTWIRVYSLILQ
jgi:hypothetical protein